MLITCLKTIEQHDPDILHCPDPNPAHVKAQPMYSEEPRRAWQSDSYGQARRNFLNACEDARCEVVSYPHPLLGPGGEALATDTAWFGPRAAGKLLVMVSGVHGVEGFSGSATQVGWIAGRGYDSLPADTAVLMVHLINPWGVAHLRRYTEGNVDLCRNFLDFSQPLPSNQAYGAVHDQLSLGELLGDHGQFAGRYLGQLLQQHGLEYVIDLFMAGQYTYPDGFAFGGQRPEWSNTTLRDILVSHNQYARQVCVIEFHTGLGPWAYGELITLHMDKELERVREWFGRWVFNPSADRQPGEEGYRVVPGHTINAYKGSFANAEVTAVTLEFGTYPSSETLALLIQEHLLVQHPGTANAADMENIKGKLLEFHHPADWEWRCAFWSRSLQVIRQAFTGLGRADNEP